MISFFKSIFNEFKNLDFPNKKEFKMILAIVIISIVISIFTIILVDLFISFIMKLLF